MKDKKTFGVKTLAALAAVALALGCVIGGTMAWLTDKTEAVTNTFTTSDIDISLEESDNLDLKMIPGYTITKDPKVTVKAGSEKCYLFVKVEKSTNFDDFMTYQIASGWTALPGVSGVYYREVDADTTKDQPFYIIQGNTVTVKGTVTKSAMNALTTDTYPTLTFTAYASQYMKNNTVNFTPAEAWANVSTT